MSSLYLEHFGLSAPPFSITPDTGFFFAGSDYGLFIEGLLHAAMQAEGIVVVVGEVGSGKTLMSRLLLNRLPGHVDTVYLPNPVCTRDEIIAVIARDLGIGGDQLAPGERMDRLQMELLKRQEQGRQVVVLIDEAHTMPMESIEEVRRLSNLETGDRKLVQIVLIGQPELDLVLAQPQLRQVRDRVVYRLTLGQISPRDVNAYLDHRLRIAGWRGGQIFSWFAQRMLRHAAKGRARRLNLLADKSLLAAYADNHGLVLARHVRRAKRDLCAAVARSPRQGYRALEIAAVSWLSGFAIAALAAAWLLSPAALTSDAESKQASINHSGITAQTTAPPALQAVAVKPPLAPSSLPRGGHDPVVVTGYAPQPGGKDQETDTGSSQAYSSLSDSHDVKISTPAIPAFFAGTTWCPGEQCCDVGWPKCPAENLMLGLESNLSSDSGTTDLPRLSLEETAPPPHADNTPARDETSPFPDNAETEEEAIDDTSRPAAQEAIAGVAAPQRLLTPTKVKRHPLTPQPEEASTSLDILTGELGVRVASSYDFAAQQSAGGTYAIQLIAFRMAENAASFIATGERILPAGQFFVRQSPDAEANTTTQASYVIYVGNFPTYDAARTAIDALPEALPRNKPIIVSWRRIYDEPWLL